MAINRDTNGVYWIDVDNHERFYVWLHTINQIQTVDSIRS